jgi:hypothetical protein
MPRSIVAQRAVDVGGPKEIVYTHIFFSDNGDWAEAIYVPIIGNQKNN